MSTRSDRFNARCTVAAFASSAACPEHVRQALETLELATMPERSPRSDSALAKAMCLYDAIAASGGQLSPADAFAASGEGQATWRLWSKTLAKAGKPTFAVTPEGLTIGHIAPGK